MPVPLRALIIEDSEDDALLIVRELRKGGFGVESKRVETREELLSALEQPWDIVISDWSLPKFGGLEALKVLRERTKTVPFVIVSGTIGEEAAVAAMKAGANDYVRKFNLPRLVPVLTRELADVEERRARRKAEAELVQARELERLKDNFVNAVSHELRTPLTSILGYAEFLEDRIAGPLTDQQEEFVRRIEHGAKRLEHLVNDLLDFARMDAGTFKLKCEPVDLAETIRRAVASVEPQAEAAQLSMTLAVDDPSLVVPMDPQRIEQVAANLLSNAIKFTSPGGRVTVRVFREGDRARCEVEDTGIGIAEADMPKLFERFVQLEGGQRRGGTGLGLSIARALVEAHDGTIGATSEVDKGSVFWFTLPLAVATVEAKDASAAAVASGPGGGA